MTELYSIDNLERNKKIYYEKLLLNHSSKKIIMDQEKWIMNNLSILDHQENILNFTYIVNTYLEIIEFNKSEYSNIVDNLKFLFMPIHLGLPNIDILTISLKKRGLLLSSLIDYGDKITGYELLNEILQEAPSMNEEIITSQLNTLLRKYLSSLYITIVR